MSAPSTQAQAPRVPSVSSSRGPDSGVLFTFPRIHEDEPEQGILPTLLSKVKSTFASASTAVPIAGGDGGRSGEAGVGASDARTEAQRLAEAVKNQRAASGHVRKSSGSLPTPALQPMAASSATSTLKVDTNVAAHTSPSIPSAGPPSSSPVRKQSAGLKPPLVPGPSSSSSGPSHPASVNSQASSVRKLPIDSRWKPRMAPSMSSVTPVTSVTHSVAHKTSNDIPIPGPSRVPFPQQRPLPHINTAMGPSRSSHNLLLQHAHSNRARRSSIATLPDSPTSMSHKLVGHGEGGHHRPYMGGFSLGNDDSRSVRSVALGKKGSQSVSRIIRRLRGEGLSKHYWMADEHCKECYDCKSVSPLSLCLRLS